MVDDPTERQHAFKGTPRDIASDIPKEVLSVALLEPAHLILLQTRTR